MSFSVMSTSERIWDTIQGALDSARAFFGFHQEPSDRDEQITSLAAVHMDLADLEACVGHNQTPGRPPELARNEVKKELITSIDNGDCLFESVANYLNLSGQKAGFSAKELREIAAGLIHVELCERAPDENLVAHLKDAIEEHNESIDRRHNEAKANLVAVFSLPDISPEQVEAAATELENLENAYARSKITANDFLAYAAKVSAPGFFANSPEMYVLAKELNIPIQVYGPGSRSGFFREMPVNFNSSADAQECALLYSPAKRHYDLLIEFEDS